jgi:hypothetical protein
MAARKKVTRASLTVFFARRSAVAADDELVMTWYYQAATLELAYLTTSPSK